MSNSTNMIVERGSEWRATAEAAMLLKLLTEAADEPSGKRFVRGRATRIERWSQLAECARKQAEGLEALAGVKAVPRKRKTPTVAAPSVPITPGHIGGGVVGTPPPIQQSA